MLHLIYVLAFTVIAFFAISNLIRSLITINAESQKSAWTDTPRPVKSINNTQNKKFHPEFFDNEGNPIDEPLLVIRSVSLDDARQQLDSLYNSSPSTSSTTEEEA